MQSLVKKVALPMLLAGTAAATYGYTAIAGNKPTATVTINTSTRTAEGAFGSTRNSADSTQFIYCDLDAFTTSMRLTCRAKNNAASPVDVSCTSTDTTLIGNIQKLSTDADLKFTWNSSGVCTSVTVDRSSKWVLKNP